MYVYDMHVHTSQASKCAKSSGKEMARASLENGYSGIVITDHFFNGYTCIPAQLPWKERVRLFCSGYEEACLEGERIGLKVFFGWEYCLNGTEFCTYGLGENWLIEHEGIDRIPVQEYFRMVHASGGFISHAHPFCKRGDIPPVQLFPQFMDAVEVWNGGNAQIRFNEEALRYAARNRLLYTAGSDSHRVDTLKGGGVSIRKPADTLGALLDCIRKREIAVVKGLGTWEEIFSDDDFR